MAAEHHDLEQPAGWVLYDADCHFCTTWARRSKKLLESRELVLVPLQTPWVRARLGLPEAQLLTEMRLLRPNGQVFRGADALLEIGRHFCWSWPLAQMGHIPGVHALLVMIYRWVARHRSCAVGACERKQP
ncbi:MAG: DUF393 domain-containing protein [Phycisphaerae bacterium]|nr:DUF393 domain-containing protein [Phycisphaerae bacterium]